MTSVSNLLTSLLSVEEKILEQQIVRETKESFSLKIEDLVWDKDIPYMEALVILMEQGDIEPERISKLLTPEILSKLEIEVEDLNLLKTKQTDRLGHLFF